MNSTFQFCLNFGTLRGFELGVEKEIEIAANAGYDSIEPWLAPLHAYRENGGSLKDLGKHIADLGLTVESGIGFAEWISDCPETRAQALEEAKRDMEVMREIGATRIAAPPKGATDTEKIDLQIVAERYRKLLEVGEELGVTPMLELWGFSTNLSRLGEVAFVAAEAGHDQSCLLLDSYHIYKGGSDHRGLALFNGKRLPVFHINDYPADPPRATIADKDRVYPGDGIAPLAELLQLLAADGTPTVLSLELFNQSYWQGDPLDVATRGLEKTKKVVEASFPTPAE